MPSSACKKCARSEEHTSELQSHDNLVCRLLPEKKGEAHDHSPGGVLDTPPARGPRHRGRPPSHTRSNPTGGSRPTAVPDRWSSFFFNDPATTGISTLPLRAVLPN